MPNSNLIVSADHAWGLLSALLTLCGILLTLVYSIYLLIVWFLASPSSSSSSFTKPSKINVGTGVLLLAYILSPLISNESSGLQDLILGTDPLLNEILKRAPSIRKGPSPPLLFMNRHLQFLPWMIQNEIHRGGIPFQRVEFEVTACIDKSQPDCTPSPLMNDTVTLDIFPPLQEVDSPYNKNFNSSSPIILFAPGLRCYSQDMPGNMILRRAFGEGFRSIVVNRRGHTPNQLLKAPRWNIFGDVEDMEQVYWHVKHNLADPHTPLFFHGISSGTAVTVSALSKWDRRRVEFPHLPSPSFVASISVTPGYDVSKCLSRNRFKFPYNDILLPAVKQHFIVQNQEILEAFNAQAVDRVLQATSLQELVNAAAPFAGYPNASAYYKGENPVNQMSEISTPKMVLNAADDPCCAIENLYEKSPYEHHQGKTFAGVIMESERGLIAVTKTGSHCPFLDGTFFPFVRDPLYGGWMLKSWADFVSIEFYKAALEVYSDRRFL